MNDNSRVFDSLDPSRNIDVNLERAHQATDSFPVEQYSLKSYEDFGRLLARFYCHVDSAIMKCSLPFDHGICLGQAHRLLESKYGKNAHRVAYSMASSGRDGGLLAILKEVAEQLASQRSSNEVSARIHFQTKYMGYEGKSALARDYIRQHGQLLPEDLKERDGLFLMDNLEQKLAKHPELIRAIRRSSNR